MIKLVATILVTFAVHISFGQDFDAVSEAFGNGNVSTITRFLDSTVELEIEGNSSTVGRGDAESQIRTFYNDKNPRSIRVVHKGVSQNDIHYMISELITSNGVYRITLYMHEVMGSYLIKSVEIEKQ